LGVTEKALASTREAAGEAILDLARNGRDVVAVSADTSKSMFTTLIRDEFPDRFIDTGIAEQNMMMVAAGAAATGKVAFAASYSVFTSMRCCEQLRTFAAYPRLNVNVIAGIGGFSAGIEGPTHMASEDLGIMRCIAGMTVLAPADAEATRRAVSAAADIEGPVYIRVGRDPSPVLFDESYTFVPGVPNLLREGSDITLIAAGLILSEVIAAADALEKDGLRCDVIDLHTVSPVTEPQIVLESARKTGTVVSVEDHNIVGGVGTVVADILAGHGQFRLHRMGLDGTFGETGTPAELTTRYGLDGPAIRNTVRELVGGN
jgi:transketolase